MNGSRHPLAGRQVRSDAIPGWRVLDSVQGPGVTPAQAATVNSRNLVRRIALEAPDGAFIIGGDTAFAVVRELGFPTLSPIGEIVAGVPVTKISAADLRQLFPERTQDLFLITKAGGFGDENVLNRVHANLSIARGVHAE